MLRLLVFVPVVFTGAEHGEDGEAPWPLALAGGVAEMCSAFSGARKNRLDPSVGIAPGSAAQIALYAAPVLALLIGVIGPTPMDLTLWPGAAVMVPIATLTAAFVTNSGRS